MRVALGRSVAVSPARPQNYANSTQLFSLNGNVHHCVARSRGYNSEQSVITVSHNLKQVISRNGTRR